MIKPLIQPVIKESSDELNPPVVTTGVRVEAPPARRTFIDSLGLLIATCGVGYIPMAPGTWGSAVGVFLYMGISAASEQTFAVGLANDWPFSSVLAVRTTFLLLAAGLVTMAGIWAASVTERLKGRKDPGIVVIDEVAGQLITFLFVPFGAGAWTLMAGFLIFRLFDIWKPYPIRRLEILESGLGIMADDVLAGLYAATVMAVVATFTILI
jgi:phosphatidylglycerophosphatase A